jgi:hypothetical protein
VTDLSHADLAKEVPPSPCPCSLGRLQDGNVAAMMGE